MAKIKLIATDLDGTFLMNGEEPHPENLQALRDCQQAGIVFCACTGRMWYEARHILVHCGFDDYCVTNNGASIMNIKTGQHQFRNRLDPQYLKQILQVAVDMQAGIMVKGYDSLYAYRPLISDIEQDWLDRVSNLAGERRIKTYSMETLEDLYQVSRYYAEKVDIRLDPHEHIDALYERLAGITDVDITASTPHSIEVTAQGANKAEALSVIAGIYGIQPAEVMTLGDNLNDITMIQWAGVGVAIGNANQRLKAEADYISPPNYEGGVAEAIYKFALGEKEDGKHV